ncbi:MAG TPA: beta-propeller domain-containing protein, partial [Anaeromyxobacteraceae bacterium]|nr:beta-propeller domain-containing protein [Anaeromyxobacteraceae bacterium]
GGDGSGPTDRSGTNDQVAGVDEPDLVKSDGAHLYVAAGGRLQVLAAWPAAETRRIATLTVPGTAKRLLVHGDRVVVFSSLAPELASPPPGGVEPLLPVASIPWPPECTYGYDCVPQGDGTPLAVTVVDVSDRAAPRIVRELRFSGSYLAARRIDDAVHVVVTSPERWFEGLDDGSSLLCRGLPERVVRAEIERLREHNRAVVEAADVSSWLPSAVDVTYAGGAPHERRPFAGCGGYWAAPEAEGTAFLSVASFSLGDDATAGVTTILGRPGFVYAAPETLYVATPQRWFGGPWFFADPGASEEATTVHAFALRSGAASEYLGSGAVKGRVLNSFALDEHDGDLRVATTRGWAGQDLSNAVTVLRHDGIALQPIGAVEGIAPGEDIRAVRFDGDRGFVVTFEKTDPLFVLDLSDPEWPRVTGELVVPGFSTYLHLVDPAHLLTIGFDADDEGSFSWFQGLRLQVFDVADPAHPALDHAEVIGARGTSSEAATDHLAFTWFAPKRLLGVPIVVCEGGVGGLYGTEVTFNGLLVYRVDPEEGFTRLGGVSHPAGDASDPYGSPCSDWWTRSTSLVKRSVFQDDFVYSLTAAELRVQDTRALGTDLAWVDLAAP